MFLNDDDSWEEEERQYELDEVLEEIFNELHMSYEEEDLDVDPIDIKQNSEIVEWVDLNTNYLKQIAANE